MSTFTDLIEYFKNIAETHTDIRHSETEKHFFRMEIDEVLAGITGVKLTYPLLILEGYSFDFTDNKSDNLLKSRSGGFILLDHISDYTDYDILHQKWNELEEIGTEILLKIFADKRSRNVPVVRDFDFSSVNASLIMNEIGSDVGVRFTYSIQSPVPNDVNPDKWL